jgi:Fe2+ transport system protein B
MLDLRRDFFQKYFMLHLVDHAEANLTKQELKKTTSHIRNREISLVKEIFEQAVKSNLIKSANTEKTAELFIDMLTGINICVLARQEKHLVPDDKDFDEVLFKQKELSQIFLSGIR